MLVLLGPSSGKITGQRKAFDLLVGSLCDEDILVLDRTKLKSISFFVNYLIRILKVNASRYYLSSSRTNYGFLIELPMILKAIIQNKPLICHVHGSDFDEFLRKNFIARFVYARPQVVVCLIHEFFTDSIEKILRKKVFVVDNFVDLDMSLENVRKDIDFIWASNLMIEKGILEFLEWALNFANKNYRIVVLGQMIGSKEEINQIDRLINRCEQSLSAFEYIGPVEMDEVSAYLLRSKVFVLNSTYRSEAVPLALLEAMACGCFVVVTEYRALPLLVSPTTSRLIASRRELLKIVPAELFLKIDDMALKNQAAEISVRYSKTNHIKNLKSIIYEYTVQS